MARGNSWGNHYEPYPFSNNCFISRADNPNDKSNFVYWQQTYDPNNFFAPPIQIPLELNYSSPCVYGGPGSCASCFDFSAKISLLYCPFTTSIPGTGGSVSGIRRPTSRPVPPVRSRPVRPARRIRNAVNSTTTSTLSSQTLSVETTPAIIEESTVIEDVVVKENFKQSYASFITKDYQTALPMLKDATHIPFGKKRSELSRSSQHKIRVAEILTDPNDLFNEDNITIDLDSNFKIKNIHVKNRGVTSRVNEETQQENLYKLKAVPNPTNNNFIAYYELGGKKNGVILIKDNITALVVKTVQLDPNKKSIPIRVNNLTKGNYILELQSDGVFLKAEHLMVY